MEENEGARKWKRETRRRQKANIECQYELPGIKLFRVLRFRIVDRLFASPSSRGGGASTRTRESLPDLCESVLVSFVSSLRVFFLPLPSCAETSRRCVNLAAEIKKTRNSVTRSESFSLSPCLSLSRDSKRAYVPILGSLLASE